MKATIIDDTVRILREHYGEWLESVTIERIAVGIFFTAVKLSSGSGGISYTPVFEIHNDPRRPPLDIGRQLRLKGTTVHEILTRRDDTAFFRTVRLVVMNALSTPLNEGRYRSAAQDSDVLDLLDLTTAKRVAMVGAIPPFVSRLRHLEWLRLEVIEKNEALAQDVRQFCIPTEQTEQVLASCDVALITGAAVANGTIDTLLQWVSPEALVIVVGPTASFVPGALFGRGVAIASGIIVRDPDKTIDMVSEGALAYHLFHECLQKVSIINPSLAGHRFILLSRPH